MHCHRGFANRVSDRSVRPPFNLPASSETSRIAWRHMGEYTVTGQIVSGRAFGARAAFCRWGVVAGPAWDLLEGVQDGQTMTAFAPRTRPAVWSHPVEMRFSYKVPSTPFIFSSLHRRLRAADDARTCKTADHFSSFPVSASPINSAARSAGHLRRPKAVVPRAFTRWAWET